MKYILFLLLICSTAITAQAQITPTQFRKSLDSVAALSRTADARQDTRLTALESNVVRLRPAVITALQRLDSTILELSTRIAQQGASLSTLNATVAGNVATDNSQALQIAALVKQIVEYGITLTTVQAAVKTAQDTANGAQGTVDNLKNYLKATP